MCCEPEVQQITIILFEYLAEEVLVVFPGDAVLITHLTEKTTNTLIDHLSLPFPCGIAYVHRVLGSNVGLAPDIGIDALKSHLVLLNNMNLVHRVK